MVLVLLELETAANMIALMVLEEVFEALLAQIGGREAVVVVETRNRRIGQHVAVLVFAWRVVFESLQVGDYQILVGGLIGPLRERIER